MATINKTQSKTFQQIILEQNINDILNKSNIILKKRHCGLTIKFDNTIENESSWIVVNDNISENKVSYNNSDNSIHIFTKEFSQNYKIIQPEINEIEENNNIKKLIKYKKRIGIKNELSENKDIFYDAVTDLTKLSKEETLQFQTVIEELEKENKKLKKSKEIIENFDKFKYNAITIFENKNIEKLRKELFNFKKELKNEKEKNNYLSTKMQKIIFDSKIKNEEISKIKIELFEIELKIKSKKNFDNNISNKKYLLKDKIQKIEKEISKIEQIKKEELKKNNENIRNITKLEKNINNLTKKIDEYNKKLNIPSTPPELWIKKSDEIAELHKKVETAKNEKQLNKIRKKIKKLDKEMQKIWNNKKIEKIYEEILPINNEVYFITTIQNIDNSINEEIIHFYQLTNGKIEVVNQTKEYLNINEYKKDVSLIENIYTNKNNLFFSKMNIKNFLKNQQNLKLKPTEIEKNIWCIFTGATLLSIASTLLLLFPPIVAIPAIAITIKATAGIMSGTRIFASFFSSEIKKVEAWFLNKFYKSKDQKEKEKTERKSIIKNLTNDKLETKLQTQYDILKQELDNRKDKNTNELSNNIINHNLNNISQNLNIKLENNQDFNSHLINDIHSVLENQPSTSTGIYHTSLLS